MSVQLHPRMTVDEFLAWADGRGGKWELVAGEVIAMPPERVRHVETRATVFDALRAAIRKNALPCRALIDGVADGSMRTQATCPLCSSIAVSLPTSTRWRWRR